MNKKIYILNVDWIPDDWDKGVDDLTDEEFIKISDGWYFNSWEEFIEAFNADSNLAPTPEFHHIRLI